MSREDGIVIVGGSYAAVNIVLGAREAGYDGPIRLMSEEAHLPYQRPPLSKDYLHGKSSEASLPIRPDLFYRTQGVELLLGVTAAAIDRPGRCVVAGDGTRIPYDRLALATGARARLLAVPGAELGGILTLRSLDDARRLRQSLPAVRRAVIVGGGFIGLEAASALRLEGKEVTVLERESRLLARAVGPEIADHLAGLHRRGGVEIAYGREVAGFEGGNGRVGAVLCADGRRYPADLVLIGVGSIPNTALAEAAGLACQDGISVDRACRTSDPRIVAAGDCTRHPSRFSESPLRLESVQNATEQGRVAGATAAGRAMVYDAVPWFWSDQFGVKLQMAGLAGGSERVERRGGEVGFSLFHYRQDRLIAVESVDRPGDHLLARKLLSLGISPPAPMVRDPGQDLRVLLAS